ncbi:hypothetical protein [Streptomyces sp. NPDC088925]|uniref:hypothetical protein n=1 Tax=Streptomyces sp. NPDC088925 TaxID=3365914 RepID=UPI0037F19466
MTTEIWASALSLTGVALGAGLTALSQRATQRSAERAEERRLRAATSESRRAERLQSVKDFLARAQEAERAAYSRPDPWGEAADWRQRAGDTMTALWIAERHMTLLCPPALDAPARTYARALNQAVWREIGDTEVNEHLEAAKTAFMATARAILSPPTDPERAGRDPGER